VLRLGSLLVPTHEACERMIVKALDLSNWDDGQTQLGESTSRLLRKGARAGRLGRSPRKLGWRGFEALVQVSQSASRPNFTGLDVAALLDDRELVGTEEMIERAGQFIRKACDGLCFLPVQYSRGKRVKP
jgi:hypothetical protein